MRVITGDTAPTNITGTLYFPVTFGLVFSHIGTCHIDGDIINLRYVNNSSVKYTLWERVDNAVVTRSFDFICVGY